MSQSSVRSAGAPVQSIGFLVGDSHYLPHARLLTESISRSADSLLLKEVCAMTPEHLNLQVELPGVTQVHFPAPAASPQLPFLDKMQAAAAFEANCTAGYLWLDVDSCFLQAPRFPSGAAISVNPVDKRNVGDVFGAPRSQLWHLINQYFQLDAANIPAVTTTVSQEVIYAYFNAGMVLVQQPLGLFRRVREALAALLERTDVQALLQSSRLAAIFLHQVVFTGAMLRLYGADSISPLPTGVNYPLHLHNEHLHPAELADLISIRYDTYFEKHRVPAELSQLFPADTEQLRMLWYY